MARAKRGLIDRGIIYTGLRGVGKTVLLRYLRDKARENGFLAVFLESSASDRTKGYKYALEQLLTAINGELKRTQRRHPSEGIKRALQSISSFSLSLGITGPAFSATFTAEDDSLGVSSLSESIEEITLNLAEEGTGFFLFIDEFQEMNDELIDQLILIQHHLGAENQPFFIIGAGLPTLTSQLGRIKSYTERLFEYQKVEALSEAGAQEAFTEPAQEMKASYSSPALALLLEASGRYPFFIQEFGQAIWELAETSPFSALDAERAIDIGTQRLDHGFFESRWSNATNAGKNYMKAMAEDNGFPSQVSIVAQRLQKATNQLSVIRNQLISKGLIYSPGHGMVAFTVPGMADYVKRQQD